MSNASPTLAATLQSLLMAVAANAALDEANVADVSAINPNVIHSLDKLSSLEQAASWTLLQLAAMIAPVPIPVLIFTEGGELWGEAWNALAQQPTRAEQLWATLAQAGLISPIVMRSITAPPQIIAPAPVIAQESAVAVVELAPQLIP